VIKMNWVAAVQHLTNAGEAYVLVTLIGVAGSTPRDSGTKMVITTEGIYDSIGGGHLEHKTIKFAQALLKTGDACQHLEHFQLGIHLDQCCGGSTNVLFECFAATQAHIMVFGAGHVGTALIPILAGLPCKITWVDSREQQFNNLSTDYVNVKKVVRANPQDEVANMPRNSYYIVLTHRHQMDFDISLEVIRQEDYAYFGLIGSRGKWQRFQQRLLQRNVTQEQLQTVNCPIGLSNVSGKLPMEVAVSISSEVIEHYQNLKSENKNSQKTEGKFEAVASIQQPSSLDVKRKQKAALHQGVQLKMIKQVLNDN